MNENTIKNMIYLGQCSLYSLVTNQKNKNLINIKNMTYVKK